MILDNVKRLCRKHGTNITELERSIGIGTGSIYKWGKSTPNVNAAKLVADFFGITVDELLRETEVAGDDAITGRHSGKA